MSNNFQKSACLIALSMMASLGAFAETINDQVIETSLAPTESFEILKKINGSIGFGYESNFYEYKASDKEQGLTLQLEFFSKYDDWKYGVNSLISRNFAKEEKTEFGDTKLFVSKSLYLFDSQSSFSSSMYVSLILPTSNVSRYEKDMYGNFSFGPSISWNKDDFSLYLLPRLGKVFTKYKTTYSGEANTSYYTKLSLAPTYQITNSLSTQLTTSVTQAWTDNHTRKAPTYASELNTELRLDPKLAVSVAISNEDKIYKSNGMSSNVKVFDKESSVYSLTVTKDF